MATKKNKNKIKTETKKHTYNVMLIGITQFNII
jgi:hypothetical protein